MNFSKGLFFIGAPVDAGFVNPFHSSTNPENLVKIRPVFIENWTQRPFVIPLARLDI